MIRGAEWALLLLGVTACSSKNESEPRTADARLGGAATALDATADAYGNSIERLTDEQAASFSYGHSVFSQNWSTAPATTEGMDGLGPLFNARACSSCHSKDGRSPPLASGGALLGMLLRLSIPGLAESGGPNPDPVYGDQLRPFGILGVPGDGTPQVSYREEAGSYGDGTSYSLQVPSYSVADWAYGEPARELMVSPRVAPALIGLGLLEAVPEAEILAHVSEPNDDGIHGVPNYVWDVSEQTSKLGRFGWKANQPSLLQQSAGAFLGDIGITSALFRRETCAPTMSACRAAASGADPDYELSDGRLSAITFYMHSLAVPARRRLDDARALRGEALFSRFGCASCHSPTLHTGADAAAESLSNQTIHPYTDLLLHDMGRELADDRPDFLATGSQWRTAPLWGIGLLPTVNHHFLLLHDGRARGLAEAILWHGGEAAPSRERFRLADSSERDALLAFLESL